MSEKKYLGVEIGGTKLQLGVGAGHTRQLNALVRETVDLSAGASGIVQAIESLGRELESQHSIEAIGVGFGGPVDTKSGVVTKSHQVTGWDNFPLGDRLQDSFGCPVYIDNDCNVAALGEANLGAGQGGKRVFYVTVGTGIGGGFVVDGRLDGNQRAAIAEIGHLRPGLAAREPGQTVESVASGWGIAAAARQRLSKIEDPDNKSLLIELCNGDVEALTTKDIGKAAVAGDGLANSVITQATECLGWGIAQVITLLAPEFVVVGGGVSLIGEPFFAPLRRHVANYVFPPLADTYQITSAALGEQVVVHGAIEMVQARHNDGLA